MILFDSFKTLNYEGAWIPFNGDRALFRVEVERYLKEALLDPEGKMVVGNFGPEWFGKEKLSGLSYSNSVEWGVVVFSRTHVLGVDLEKSDRVLKKSYLELAQRFFHPAEFEWLNEVSIFDGATLFLELWMQKEAYSKMLRVNLTEIISQKVPKNILFETFLKTRFGYRVVLSIAQA